MTYLVILVMSKADPGVTDLVTSSPLLPLGCVRDSTHGHHQMVDTEIRLIIFFAAKKEKLYTVSKNKTGS